jgi:hypothetical protein
MRHTALILTLILVGCATELPDESEDDEESDDGDVSSAADTHNPDNCPGGGGGGGGGGEPSGGPGDQPARKSCSRDQGLDACLDCCFYNHDKVDGWKCRRIKGDSERQRAKRRKCWEDAAEELSRCQVQTCGRDRPIITITTGEP